MAENKKNIFTKVKNWWNNLSKEDRGWLIGSLVGGFAGGLGAAVFYGRKEQNLADNYEQICKDMSQRAYSKGLHDGEINAYINLINKPDVALRRMGFNENEIKHF